MKTLHDWHTKNFSVRNDWNKINVHILNFHSYKKCGKQWREIRNFWAFLYFSFISLGNIFRYFSTFFYNIIKFFLIIFFYNSGITINIQFHSKLGVVILRLNSNFHFDRIWARIRHEWVDPYRLSSKFEKNRHFVKEL